MGHVTRVKPERPSLTSTGRPRPGFRARRVAASPWKRRRSRPR
jgi:hypothetical protein